MGAVRYKPYPAYKSSGIEWIEEIPAGWTRTFLGFGCSVKARLGWKGLKADEYVDDGYVFLATPNIKNDEIDFKNVNYITKKRYDESPEIALEVGDVLVTKDGSTTGTTNVVRALDRPATVNSSIAVIRSLGEFNSVYLYYYFSTKYTQSVINRMRGGMGVPHLFQADLRKFNLMQPSLGEQTKIAAFLDYETGKIDALIAKQERLIALLEEKRQAVISHAVTKGLNPNAPLRPSGIDWLGDVPEHWEVKRLKYLCNVNTGTRNTEDAKEDGKFPFFVRSQTVQKINTGPYDCEAILTAGDGAGVGKVYHYFEGRFDCHQRVYMLTDFEELTGKFIFDYLENNFFNVALAGQAKSTVDSLRMPVFLNFDLTVPPREEQLEIVNHVAAKKRHYLALSNQAQSAITLLKERRTALISAAVTGKIDVRDWQPPQPLSDTDLCTETLQEAAL